MKTYVYQKKIPKYREYKPQNKAVKAITTLSTRRRFGLLLILLGVFLIAFPLSENLFFSSKTDNVIVNPVPLSTLVNSVSISNTKIDSKNPLSSYISNHKVEKSRTSPFYISFPSLKLNMIKVTPNVDSTNAEVYEKVLQSSTAQLAGSSLPGDGGNTFIYGHSSITWFHDLYPKSYEGVFTALFDLKIGNRILITMDNTNYSYIIEGITTINADDYSQIQNITGTNTLTLMTCSPPGVGEKRLIVKAVQI